MPSAVAVTTDHERHELKSLEGGFVVLRRMTYGQIIHRRGLMKLSVSSGKGKDFQGEMAMANEAITRYEFAQCIVEHNLEDENGKNLNLSQARDFDRLDPRVGQEIDMLISKMNNFDADEEDEQGN